MEEEVKLHARLPEVADDIIALGGVGVLTRRNVTGLNVKALVLRYEFHTHFKVHELSEDVTVVRSKLLPLIYKNTNTVVPSHTRL